MRRAVLAAIAILLAVIGWETCTYTVYPHQIVVERVFKEIAGPPVTTPGLKWKLPWVEAVVFDKRWLAWDGDPNQITTLDKRYIRIDVFARWRIADPLVFLEKLGNELLAQGRLDDILDSATRNVIASHDLIEAIRSSNRTFQIPQEERENLMADYEAPPGAATAGQPAPAGDLRASPDTAADTETAGDTAGTEDDTATADAQAAAPADTDADTAAPQKADRARDEGHSTANLAASYTIAKGRQTLTAMILAKARPKARELGIELKDVRIKRIDYVESVQQAVFQRMISERQKVAARFRAQGDGLSAEILGRKQKDLQTIRSNAYRIAEEIKGRADAEAARIYADAYRKDPELYRFLKTLEAYRTAMAEHTWLVLSTKSQLGRYLESDAPSRR